MLSDKLKWIFDKKTIKEIYVLVKELKLQIQKDNWMFFPCKL